MSKKMTFRAIGVLAVVALATWAGLALAEGHPSRLMQHPHHAAHGHQQMAKLIDALDLNDAQQQHIAAIHELLSNRMLDGQQAHGMHLAALTELVQTGELTQDGVRSVVDLHVDQLRHLGYQLGDQLVALIDSLDGDQRAVLTEHLEHAAEHMQAGDFGG